MQDVEVVAAILAIACAVCALLQMSHGGVDGAQVVSSTAADSVEPMKHRVDKLRVVPRIPGAQY